jgi:hypothetical protein
MAAARSVQALMAREMQLRHGDAAGERTMELYVALVGSLMYLMSVHGWTLLKQWEHCHGSRQILEDSIVVQHRRCCSML